MIQNHDLTNWWTSIGLSILKFEPIFEFVTSSALVTRSINTLIKKKKILTSFHKKNKNSFIVSPAVFLNQTCYRDTLTIYSFYKCAFNCKKKFKKLQKIIISKNLLEWSINSDFTTRFQIKIVKNFKYTYYHFYVWSIWSVFPVFYLFRSIQYSI